MTLRQLALIVFTVTMLSVGQILFKYAAGKIDIAGKGLLFGLILNPAFIAAMVVYAFATLSWIYVLRSAPLRLAYPFAALAFIIVPLFAWLFLGEALRWTTFAGALLIILGVCITLL